MEDHQARISANPARRIPWNNSKLVGGKLPLQPSDVWSIGTKLQIEGKKMDLALFNFAIRIKLRVRDVMAIVTTYLKGCKCAAGDANWHAQILVDR